MNFEKMAESLFEAEVSWASIRQHRRERIRRRAASLRAQLRNARRRWRQDRSRLRWMRRRFKRIVFRKMSEWMWHVFNDTSSIELSVPDSTSMAGEADFYELDFPLSPFVAVNECAGATSPGALTSIQQRSPP